MINTYFESSLHRALKDLYSLGKKYKCEVEIAISAKFHPIFDILMDDGTIIEIQTKNLSALSKKIEQVLLAGMSIKVVYPIAKIKNILTYDAEGRLLKKVRSPKHENIYTLFRGLTKIYTYLLNPNFTLEVLFIELNELRKAAPSGYHHQKSRHKTNYIKIDKTLENIFETKVFNKSRDYLSVINEIIKNTSGNDNFATDYKDSKNCPPDKKSVLNNNICNNYINTSDDKIASFCIKDFPCNKIDAQYTLWVLQKMNLIKLLYKIGNLKYYTIATSANSAIFNI